MNDLIINFCPTGMIPTKDMTPYVPITPEEIARDVKRAMDIGITMVHLHARYDIGAPCWSKEFYSRIIEKVREFGPELVICVSTSGRHGAMLAERLDVLRLDGDVKPDVASLTLSSLNFNKESSVNPPKTIRVLAKTMRDSGIKPELEVFDTGMVNYAKYLADKGIIEAPYYFNLILGNSACAQATPLHLGVMVNDLPPYSFWSVGGVGDYQLTANAMAIAAGGGVRVGLEDNIWWDSERDRLATNENLLVRIHNLADIHLREVMTPAQLRKGLELKPGNGEYGVA